MRLLTVTILALAVLTSTAHPADPPSAKEVFAQVTSDSIRTKEEALAHAGDRVAATIRRFTRTDEASQDATFEEMQKHLALLRPVAEEALKGYADFRTASESLRKELAESPTAYRLAAEAFRQKAKTYETAELRRRILDLAQNCERLIPIMEERVRRLDTVTTDAEKMERFLKETNRFLGDFGSFLKLYPGNQTLELRRSYRSHLESYKKAFETMLKNMDDFTDRLKTESGSEKLRAERDAEREKARAMEVAAREEQAAAKAESERRIAQGAAWRSNYEARMRNAYESRLLHLRFVYTTVLRYPRSLLEAQVAALSLQEIELRLYALRISA